jgi:hypothetical protein
MVANMCELGAGPEFLSRPTNRFAGPGEPNPSGACFAPFAIRLQFRPDQVYFVRS